MQHPVLQKKIPTLLGIFVILGGIIITSLLVGSGLDMRSRATPLITASDVKVSNITDKTFIVSYTTQTKATGVVSVGTDASSLTQTVLDDQDASGKVLPHNIHYFTVKNLKPQTQYYFSITNGAETVLNDKVPFTVTTGPTLSSTNLAASTVSGKVISPTGSNLAGAIVYLSAVHSQVVSTLTKSDGTYSFNLATLRTLDLASYAPVLDDSVLTLLITDSASSSNIRVLGKDAANIPLVTISKNYDFYVSPEPLSTDSETTATGSSILEIPATVGEGNTPEIVTPKKDQAFTDAQPLFSGIASPSADIIISIHSDANIQATIKAQRSGTWTYRPTKPLDAGAHTISVTTRDQFGILKTLTQQFTIHAAGSQVGQSATPSATVVPSPTRTPTPTTTPQPSITVIPTTIPTVIPSSTPTNAPTATTIPTQIPTRVPTQPIATQIPGQTSVMTSPGPADTLVQIGGIGVILSIIGGILLFAL